MIEEGNMVEEGKAGLTNKSSKELNYTRRLLETTTFISLVPLFFTHRSERVRRVDGALGSTQSRSPIMIITYDDSVCDQ